MRRGFLNLVAIVDWSTREALNESIHRFGPPEIMNMEHGRAIGSSGHATSGFAVYLFRPDRRTEPDQHPDPDGLQGSRPRQHRLRAPLAVHDA